MKTKRLCFLWVFSSVWLLAGSAWGLDLKQYQGFMNPKLPPARAPKSVPVKKFHEVIPKNQQANFRYGDADASYQQQGAKLVTLPDVKKSVEGLVMPRDTRIPEGLRPLMTDRKYPREGLSLAGNTGAMLVPSPGVLEIGKTAVGVHVAPFSLYSVNDTKFNDTDYFDSHIALCYGVFDGFELGIDKVYSNQDRFDIPQPMYVNAKYQVPGNITVGGNFCTDDQAGYHSMYVTAGVPALWVGVGANFGAEDFRFSYVGADKVRKAKYGGYNYKYDRATGYADPAFFLVGGAVPLSKAAHFVYDFNGDRFSLGFRLNYMRVVFLDAAYISDGDYERLPGAVSHKNNGNFVFGGSLAF